MHILLVALLVVGNDVFSHGEATNGGQWRRGAPMAIGGGGGWRWQLGVETGCGFPSTIPPVPSIPLILFNDNGESVLILTREATKCYLGNI